MSLEFVFVFRIFKFEFDIVFISFIIDMMLASQFKAP